MAEELQTPSATNNHNHNTPATITATATTKLVIISVDCDPKSELCLPNKQPQTWNTIFDALTASKYCFATRRLPSDHNLSKKVAYLTLQASKKTAILQSCNNVVELNYEISYNDSSLLNALPSYIDIKGLPRFHLFTSLPEDIRLNIIETYVDGVGFATLKCVSRELKRLDWNRSFSIAKKRRVVKHVQRVQQSKEEGSINGEGSGGGYFPLSDLLVRFASAICFAAVMFGIGNEIRPGVRVYEFDEVDYGDDADEY